MTSHKSGAKRVARRPNPKGTGERLRDELLEAAARVVARDGHKAITLRAVAREARVSAPAIYLQFADRDGLVLALAERTWGDLASLMQTADQRAAREGAFARLEAQLMAYVDFATSKPAHYELLFGIAAQPAVTTPRDAVTASVYWTLEAAVARCRAEGYRVPLSRSAAPYDPNTVLLFVIAHGLIAVARTSQIETVPTPERIREFVSGSLKALVTPFGIEPPTPDTTAPARGVSENGVEFGRVP